MLNSLEKFKIINHNVSEFNSILNGINSNTEIDV